MLIPLDRSVAHARTRLDAEARRPCLDAERGAPVLRNAPAAHRQRRVAAGASSTAPRASAGLRHAPSRGSEPGAAGSLSLRLEKAPFDTLMAWLARLAQQNGVVVDSATIEKTGDAGPGERRHRPAPRLM